MRKVMRMVLILATVMLLVWTFFLTGCTKHPNEEQLNALEETKKAALSAEEQLDSKRQAKADLERRLAAKKSELEKVKREKETVKSKLSETNP